MEFLYKFFGKEITATQPYVHKNTGDFSEKEIFSHVQMLKNEISSIINVDGLELSILNQIHGDEIFFVDEISNFQKADGQITNLTNVGLVILTADCSPILFYDQNAKIIGACHAGWRGAFAGLPQKMVQKMCKFGAKIEDLQIIIGPMIAQESYEISEEFYQNFLQQNADNEKFFALGEKEGHHMFNLGGYIEENLLKTMVKKENLQNLKIDTFSHKSEFYSYRRSYLDKREPYGSNVSVMIMKNSKNEVIK